MPKADNTPLTDEQRQRASADPSWRIPYALAERFARKRNGPLLDEAQGYAMHAYISAARRFDPSRCWNGEDGFPAYALWRVGMWLRKSFRQSRRRREDRTRPLSCLAGRARDSLRADMPCPYRIVAGCEDAAIALAAMDGGQREAFLLALGGANLTEEAQRRGLSRATLTLRARTGAKRAQQAMGQGRREEARRG